MSTDGWEVDRFGPSNERECVDAKPVFAAESDAE